MCNHPDLFEGRAIVSAFDAPSLELAVPSPVVHALQRDVWSRVELGSLLPVSYEGTSRWEADAVKVRPRKRGKMNDTFSGDSILDPATQQKGAKIVLHMSKDLLHTEFVSS